MDREQVPQDAGSTYGGRSKLVYAVDDDGRYAGVPSRGWDVESLATRAAIEENDRLRDDAFARASNGETAPIEVHMYDRRMDVALLAGASGLWRWQVRRHFNPRRFARLAPRIMQRYSDALGLDIETLRQLPPPRELPDD